MRIEATKEMEESLPLKGNPYTLMLLSIKSGSIVFLWLYDGLFLLSKQSQMSRSVLYNRSRFLGLF